MKKIIPTNSQNSWKIGEKSKKTKKLNYKKFKKLKKTKKLNNKIIKKSKNKRVVKR